MIDAGETVLPNLGSTYERGESETPEVVVAMVSEDTSPTCDCIKHDEFIALPRPASS